MTHNFSIKTRGYDRHQARLLQAEDEYRSLDCQLRHTQVNAENNDLGEVTTRSVRYGDEKLSKADKSAFMKLLATYRYRKI